MVNWMMHWHLMVFFLIYVEFALHPANGSRGVDFAAPPVEQQAASPVYYENVPTTIAPIVAPISEGSSPPTLPPHEPIVTTPIVQGNPPSPPPTSAEPPLTHERSASSPEVDTQPQIAPSLPGAASHSSLSYSSPPPLPSTSKRVDNGASRGDNFSNGNSNTEVIPASSPQPHESTVSSSVAPPPLIFNSPPRIRRRNEQPAPAPTSSDNQSGDDLARNTSSSGVNHRALSPLPSRPLDVLKVKPGHHVSLPVVEGPSSDPPKNSSIISYNAPPPLPSHTTRTRVIHSPTPPPPVSLLTRIAPKRSPKQALVPPAASTLHHKHALPPPPPNLDCISLTCVDPLTTSAPGSPCACLLPMKVGLRLSVALFTFFPLVSELSQEIANGTSMKQSQVRIMGANAAMDQTDKSIILVYFVPIGEHFDESTAIFISEMFWQKKVGIQTSYFGEYDVLYVTYPGLPPSPPMPSQDMNVNGTPFDKKEMAKKMHPLGVDVPKRKEKHRGGLMAITILSSVVAFVVAAVAVWFLLQKVCVHSQGSATSLPLFQKRLGDGPPLLGSCQNSESQTLSSSIRACAGSAKTFGASEIRKATNQFDDSRIIGEGGFGYVYQGTLEDGSMVAVKVLKRDDQQGSREFLAEVEILGRLHHRNLVKLIGICTEEHLQCLVYELIQNGTVESHLHGLDKEISPLDWSARMKIALGSARGLAYLHEDSSPCVIHRDFKSSNILLEQDFTPKVSDFGLAKTAQGEGNHVSTRIVGTFGYVAPEYAMTGHLLAKSDVYSYGVVLLELLTGRKPVDMSQPSGQENLVAWARPLLTNKDSLEMIVDPALGSDVRFTSLAKVAAIASMCVQPEVSHRPFMGEVVQALRLVCNESNEDDTLGKCSPGLNSISVCKTVNKLSASELFTSSPVHKREASDPLWRCSSSGPLKSSKSGKFWKKLRSFSQGSTSEHGIMLGFRMTEQGWQ